MSINFNKWDDYAASEDLNSLVNLIVTNNDVTSCKEDTNLNELITSNNRRKNRNLSVLDFGCGVCRNSIPMAINNPSWSVAAYDNEAMLNRAKEYAKIKHGIDDLSSVSNLSLYSNWDLVKNQKFRVVFATFVLQHINESNLSTYLSDIKEMTRKLVVVGRTWNDHSPSKNTWQILEDNGFMPSNDNHPYPMLGADERHFAFVYNW